MVRWSRLRRNCRAKHKFPQGDDTYFAQYFSWCGHIARISTRDSSRERDKQDVHEQKYCTTSGFLKKIWALNVMDDAFVSGNGSRPLHNVLVKSGLIRPRATLDGEQNKKR